jgi:hypothetical protein
MTRRRLLLAAASAVLAVTVAEPLGGVGTRPAHAAGSTSSVVAGTKRVQVNGADFTGKGYMYWPAEIGMEIPYSTWAEPQQCEYDAQLLQGAGVTLLRISWEDNAPALLTQYRQCMDSFWNHGIGIVWVIQPQGISGAVGEQEEANAPATFVARFKPWIQQAVTALKDHPATYMWTIGNELDGSINGQCQYAHVWLGTAGGALGVAEPLFAYLKSLDSTHLVGTTIGHCADDSLGTMNVPSLDFWGVNEYGYTHDPGTGSANWFTRLSTTGTGTYDSRPVLLTEFGTDRFTCIGGGFGHGIICDTATSGEDPVMQRSWDVQAWQNVAANLSSASNPQGPVFGGTLFMFSDLWWYSFAGFNPVSPESHDVYGSTVSPIGGPDGVENFEWWGVSGAVGSPRRRPTTLTFDGLAAQWSSNPQPTISNLSVAFTQQVSSAVCGATVSFTTAVAGDTEILVAVDGRVFSGGGIYIAQDNTTFGPAGSDGTQETTHTAKNVVWNFVPGVSYEFSIRSTTAAGMSATNIPLIATAHC